MSYLTSVFPQIIKQRKLLGWFIWEVEVITYTSTKYTTTQKSYYSSQQIGYIKHWYRRWGFSQEESDSSNLLLSLMKRTEDVIILKLISLEKFYYQIIRLEQHWRLSTILKQAKKCTVWSNVFWYVEVCILWKCILDSVSFLLKFVFLFSKMNGLFDFKAS